MIEDKLEKEAVNHCDEVMCSICEKGSCPPLKKCKEWRDRRAGYYCGIESREKQIEELEQQIERMKKYGKLLQDICTVMGNDIYMVSVGLENRVKVLWDSSEEKEGLKMVEDIENRLLKITPQDWAEIEKWEIK